VTVVRTGGNTGAVSIDFSTSDGTATDGADYQGEAVTVMFAEGETSKTIPVLVFDDGLVEGTETIVLTLQNPSSGARLGLRKATIQLRDANQP
jgi:hypothetical protein